MDEPKVRIAGTRYRVELDGEDHYVGQNRPCSCGRACQAVRLVAEYLADGGRPAPVGIPLPTLTVPAQCPLCGAEVEADPRLDGQRGTGLAVHAGPQPLLVRAVRADAALAAGEPLGAEGRGQESSVMKGEGAGPVVGTLFWFFFADRGCADSVRGGQGRQEDMT